MAQSLASYVLTRYFFGAQMMKDTRRVQLVKQMFLNDMQFNLNTGRVSKATVKFSNRTTLEDVLTYYENGRQVGLGSATTEQ